MSSLSFTEDNRHPRVYLAGPDVFDADAAERGAILKRLAKAYGFEGLWPLDNEITETESRYRAAIVIETGNIRLLDSAAAIIANISPFRGPNMDPGTAFEIGYGRAKGLPVFAWSSDRRTLKERTEWWRRLSKRAPDAERYDSQRRRIEDFGLVENLMIAVPAGQIHRTPAEAMLQAAIVLGTETVMAAS